jgi:hypothetical protein
MKKIIVILIIILIAVVAYLKFFKKQPYDEIASNAEKQGKFDVALTEYVKALFNATESLACPDKNKPNVNIGDEWIQEIKNYISWVSYSRPHGNGEINKIIEGIKRCTSSVTNHNFITEKEPVELVKDSLIKEWIPSFIHSDDNNEEKHLELISSVMRDSLSLFRIRAHTGYTYNAKLLNLKTGNRTDFTLYPNSNITLLIQPGNYFLICSSEKQFTEGLKVRSWYSPENVIPVIAPNRTSLYRVTLKSRVSRTHK